MDVSSFPLGRNLLLPSRSPLPPNLASSTIGQATEKSCQITTLNSRPWKLKCKAKQSPLVQADHIISCLHMIWGFRIAEDEPLTCHLDLDLWGIVLPLWDSCLFKLKRPVMTKTYSLSSQGSDLDLLKGHNQWFQWICYLMLHTNYPEISGHICLFMS